MRDQDVAGGAMDTDRDLPPDLESAEHFSLRRSADAQEGGLQSMARCMDALSHSASVHLCNKHHPTKFEPHPSD